MRLARNVHSHRVMQRPRHLTLTAAALLAASATPALGQASLAPLTDTLGDESFAPVRIPTDPFQPTPATSAYFGGMAYVAGTTPSTGHELFRIDPASGEVTLVADVNPGPSGSEAYDFHVVGDHLYFAADDGTHGHELWRTDGVLTERVTDLRSGGDDGLATMSGNTFAPAILAVVDEMLYLRMASSTVGVSVLATFEDASGAIVQYAGARSPGQVFMSGGERFTVDDFDRVIRLGEAGATEQLTGTFGPNGTFVPVGERLLIDHSADVIFYDPAGNRFDTAYDAGSVASGTPDLRLERDGELFFFSAHDELGIELWRTDGTVAGTSCLDLNAGAGDAPLRDPVVWRGHIVGHDADFSGTRIHAFDPATGEIALVEDRAIDQYSRLAVFDDALFFLTDDDVVYRKDALDAPAVAVTPASIGNERILAWHSLGDLLLLYDGNPAGDQPWFAYGLDCDGERTADDVSACAGETVTVDGREVVAPAVVTAVDEVRAAGCDDVHVTYVRASGNAGELVLSGPDSVLGDGSFTLYSESGPVTWSDGSVGDSLVVDTETLGGSSGTIVFSAIQAAGEGCDLQAQIAVYYDAVVPTREALAKATTLKAFPNPTADIVRLPGLTAGAATRVFDATGRRVLTGRGDRLDLSALPDGTYHVVAETAAGVRRARVVKWSER